MNEKTKEALKQRRLSEKETIDTYLEMGKILEEELGLKMIGFDPGFSLRDDDWGTYRIPLDLAFILIRKFVELRVYRETIEELHNVALEDVVFLTLNSVEAKINEQIS